MPDEQLNQRDLDFLHEALTRIEHKQDLTNGRVTSLERTNIYIRGFMAGLAIIFALPATAGTIIGLILAFNKL